MDQLLLQDFAFGDVTADTDDSGDRANGDVSLGTRLIEYEPIQSDGSPSQST